MWSDHLVIVPVVLPLLAGAILLLIDPLNRRFQSVIIVTVVAALIAIALIMVCFVGANDTADMVVYHIGNWPVPFGIVFVLDRLSAMMVLLTAVLAFAALLFALAQTQRAGPNFHSLFLFLLAGLNGAFLTGDLFNLFVFLEVLLAASYGLVLHGSGENRVRAGLHYVVVNLAGASLLLIGISLLYGVTGTLNMADIAAQITALDQQNRSLATAGGAFIGVALLLKAGIWPLSFWLPPTYEAASAPISAVFAIMTKVGVYAILRMHLLMTAGTGTQFGVEWLLIGGLATVAFGTIGMVASQSMEGIAGYSVIVSSGTLLAVLGTGEAEVIGSVLFYLVSSTLVIGAYWLLIELIERGRAPGADLIAITMEAFGEEDDIDIDKTESGRIIPGTFAFLGISFMTCALLLAGLPPLSGFIAKFAILSTLFNSPATATATGIPWTVWLILGLVLVSGLGTLIATSRTGIRTFWAESDRPIPQVHMIEVAPIALLLALCAGLTVGAGPVMRYMEDTATYLRTPSFYINGVLSSPTQTSAPASSDQVPPVLQSAPETGGAP